MAARRVALPKADDLFRPTAPAVPEPEPEAEAGKPRPSGRVRHDEKMTVYVTSEELLAIEQARLSIRSAHGLAVDRGRIVRAAVALALADLEANGEGSALITRLREA